MLPKINGKSFLECSEDDLHVLIDNPDYRENEYIDYKQNFAFLEIPKGKERNEKIVEFKNDVCAFANAEGGYLIYGISDINGCASEVLGIEIIDDNTDRFELDRRNNLAAISPKIPHLSFHFIKLENGKYVVMIYVKRDAYAPYTHIEDEKNYKIYKRVGNRKQVMTYTELKNMFNQSLSLDKEIHNYRLERIIFYKNQEHVEGRGYSQFMLLHMIPETFLDSSNNLNMFVLEKMKNIHFSSIFSSLSCANRSIPCVDGLRFIPWSKDYDIAECHVYNNRIVECFFSLYRDVSFDRDHYPKGYLPWVYVWEKVKDTYLTYVEVFKKICQGQRVFFCFSLVGCKEVTTENKEFGTYYVGKIDRNKVLCEPVCVLDLQDEKDIDNALKKLYIEYMLAIGVKHDETLTKLIEEVYNV